MTLDEAIAYLEPFAEPRKDGTWGLDPRFVESILTIAKEIQRVKTLIGTAGVDLPEAES